MPATGNKAKAEVVSDILNEEPTGGVTQNNVLKNVESVVSISKKHKKKGNRVLRFFKARWGESKVPINGLTLDAGLKNEEFQEYVLLNVSGSVYVDDDKVVHISTKLR